MTDLVVGVDRGGSKTRVILADSTGAELADVTGPGSAMAPGRGDHSAGVIAELVRQALDQANIVDRKPRALVAGVGRPAQNRELTVALEDLELADEIAVEGDGEIALTDAFGFGPGIILI